MLDGCKQRAVSAPIEVLKWDVKDPQRRHWMELWGASLEVVRRRLAEHDGEVVDHPARRESASTKEPQSKSGPDFAATLSSHTGVRVGEGPG